MKWLFKRYMIERHIENLKELSELTGIKYRTLLDRMEKPQTLRVYEIEALNKILMFRYEDVLAVMRGEK